MHKMTIYFLPDPKRLEINMKKNNKGLILLTLIAIILIIGIFGAAFIPLLTNYSYNIVSYSKAIQAYYISESGQRYALNKLESMEGSQEFIEKYGYKKKRFDMPYALSSDNEEKDFREGGIFSFETSLFEEGSRFLINRSSGRIYRFDKLSEEKEIVMEAQRKTNIFRTPPRLSKSIKNDRLNWKLCPSQVTFYDDNVNEQSAMTFWSKRDENKFSKGFANLYLNWQENYNLPDLKLWQDRETEVLSYKIQVKSRIPVNYKNFMTGISFRVSTDSCTELKCYGISIFKTAGRNNSPPPWLDEITFKFEGENCKQGDNLCLETDKIYMVLWVKTESSIKLIRYCDLKSFLAEKGMDYVFQGDLWTTISVIINERETAGQKLNEIRGGILFEKTEKYSNNRNGPSGWAEPCIIKWDNGNKTIVDKSIVSSTDLEEEAGLHLFYDEPFKITADKPASKDDIIWFDDAFLACHSGSCPNGTHLDIVQY